MKRDYSFNYSGKTGFVVLPRKLLVEAMQNNGNEMTEPQAFVSLLLHTNYSDQKTRQGFCPRGESVISIREWSRMFGWGEWKTRRFFDELIADGIIEFFRDTRPHRLRLVKYEQYCANKSETPQTAEEKPASKSDRMFEEFWKNYHEINGIEPTDRMAAYREWKKLKLSEKQLAMENISTYFWRQSDIRHIKKAVNYLKDKSFIL